MKTKTWFELENLQTGDVLVRESDLFRANRRRFFAPRQPNGFVVKFKTEKLASAYAKQLFASDRTDLPKFIVVVRFQVVTNRVTTLTYRNPKAPPAKRRAA